MSKPRPFALALPILAILAGALVSPPRWDFVWAVAPLLGALGYLGNIRPRRWGWVAPLAVAVWLVASSNAGAVWGWVILGVAATTALFGFAVASFRRSGESLWAFSPLLGLVALFPVTAPYATVVPGAVASVRESGERAFEQYRALGIEGAALQSIAQNVDQATEILVWSVQNVLPAMLFVWSAMLVLLGIFLARRLRAATGRPLGPRPSFVAFRMPEGAIWILVAALAAIAIRVPEVRTIGMNLAICVGVGYCVQGLAVAEYGLMLRGLRRGMIWVMFLFVAFFALPVLLVSSTLLGLADVWLDLRRRPHEPDPEEQQA